MRTVWKFPLDIGFWTAIEVPGTETKVVLVGLDPESGRPAVWIECEPTQPPMTRSFQLVGTGSIIPSGEGYDPVEHVGSVIDGSFVWHIYERTLYYGG